MLKQAGPRSDPHGPQVPPASTWREHRAERRKLQCQHTQTPFHPYSISPGDSGTGPGSRGRQPHQRRKDAARRSYHGKRAASRQTLPALRKRRILGAAFLRLTAEASAARPRAGTPRERWHGSSLSHAAANATLAARVSKMSTPGSLRPSRKNRQTHRAPRLAPRRCLDALLQAASRTKKISHGGTEAQKSETRRKKTRRSEKLGATFLAALSVFSVPQCNSSEVLCPVRKHKHAS